jgi:uncharacterized repeat protein (TIGR02543 family)
MAGPHVAGVVALLWSARPDLVRNIAATKQVLTGSANPVVGNAGTGCGGSSAVPNNNFGWGLVDAAAAYNGSNHVLTVAKSGTGTGSVTSAPAGVSCGTVCSASYPSGGSVTLTATAATGSTFTGWSGDCTGTGACTVTMDGDHSATANFQLVRATLRVTKAGSGTGKVTSSPSGINCGTACSASFDLGASVTLKASAASGSRFTGWSGDCADTNASCKLKLTADRAATATFASK